MSSTLTAIPSQPNAFPGTFRIRRIPAPWRDSAVIFAIIVATTILCVRFDVSEMLRRWTAPWERMQLDELPGILLVLAIALVWFAARRYREAARELERRCLAEERVAAALATNRRLSQQYVRLQESERKTIAQELHDELGQYLNVIKLDAVGIRDDKLEGAEAPRARAADIVENCDRIHRALAALIRQLRPVGLDELGLPAAVEHCVDAWRTRLGDTEIEICVTGDFSQLPEILSLTVYRLVQEGLTNIAKHAAAHRVAIELAHGGRDGTAPQEVRVTMTDDGLGADLTIATGGLGLVGMRERVAALAGTVEVTSSPGRGFQLRAAIPLASSS